MDTVSKIMGIAFVGAVLAVFLKEKTPQFSMAVSLITGVVIFFLIADTVKNAVAGLWDMVSHTQMEPETVGLVLKICGIGIVAEYFCNVISDAGETAIAKKAEFAVKAIIFVMILPLVGKVVDTVWSLF